jgi:hypothetical protein
MMLYYLKTSLPNGKIAYVDLAPDDWTMSQLVTTNEAVLRHGMNSLDPWIFWTPNIQSTICPYILNLEDMHILEECFHVAGSP